MQQMQGQSSKRPGRLRIIGFITALLILIVGAFFWALSSLNSLPALLTTIFGALATIFSFFQLVPIIFAHNSPQPANISQSTPVPQPINIYNVLPSPQPAQIPPAPGTSTPPSPLAAPSFPNASTLRAFPLPTDPRTIQQREHLVEDVYTLLTAPGTAAVAITGIGGIGKSTLAALVLNHAERERRLGKGPFHREPILLRINENTSFLELATNLFVAVEKPIPDLASISPQNQAFAIFNALNSAEMADSSRLIILDQFENFLDLQSGYALPTSAGVGELLDALNSQPGACRVLLTSRPRPHGTRNDAPASLRIVPVGGLDLQEGAALLRSLNVKGTGVELAEAVKRCEGHALSLTLLGTLLQTYVVSLMTLLHDPTYIQLWQGRIAHNLLNRIFSALPEPSRQLLCAFSVYREAIPIEAALAVIDSTTKEQALLILGSLLDQHLVQAQTIERYYRLHPIVATYAHQHFVQNDEGANMQQRQKSHTKAAHYYVQVATVHCPPANKRRKISDVQPLIEAVWQFCQAQQFQEAYELMEQEALFGDLRLWGGNSILLDLCQILLSTNWPFTPQQKALIYTNMALTVNVLGQKQEALKYNQEALLITREVGDRGGEGTTLNNLGFVYDDLGQKQEALKYYQEALLIRREVGDREGEAVTLSNLGLNYHDIGQTQEALQYYQEALLIAREVGDRRGEGTTLNNLGGVYHDLGQKQEALKYHQEALLIRREVGDRGGEGATLNNLGLVYDSLGQKQEALKYYQEALLIAREVGNRRGEGTTLHNIGIIYENRNRYETALACFLLAKTLYEQVQSPSDIDNVVQWLADLRKNLGEKQFSTLLAQVEPQAEQITEAMLRERPIEQ